MKKILVSIKRFDGTKLNTDSNKDYYQDYEVDYEKGKTIAWLLTKIREEQDMTLNFTISCLHAICGACGVKINGSGYLTCSTTLDEVLETFKTEEENDKYLLKLIFEPMDNFKVIKDLVVDFTTKIEKMKKISPWLKPAEHGSLEEGFKQSKNEFKKIASSSDCILCGLCTSMCEQLSKNDGKYHDPFIFNKAYRFAADSRDASSKERIVSAMEGELWKCVHCMKCTAVCPKEIDIAENIAFLHSGYNLK